MRDIGGFDDAVQQGIVSASTHSTEAVPNRQLERLLDDCQHLIQNGRIEEGFQTLVDDLDRRCSERDWATVVDQVRSHSLHKLLLEDPFTSHGWRQPRGYAGDAALIDLIYGHQPSEEISGLAAAMLNFSTNTPTAIAVRQRMTFARDLLESAARAQKSVCSLACGLWREGDCVVSPIPRATVLVDQDELSIEDVRRRHGANVETSCTNVFSFLRTCLRQRRQFDLVYTLGLTDYFDARQLRLFVQMAAGCLNDGGQLLVANFVPRHVTRGYMDACMNWRLILRDAHELAAAGEAEGLSCESWRDQTGLIAYCRMTAGPEHSDLNKSTKASRPTPPALPDA